MFSGYIPTLVTPFHQRRIDSRQLHELIEWHINQGCSALCVGGTIGEIYSLNIDEQEELFNLAAQSIRRRIPFVVNIMGHSTRKAIWLTQAAEAAGAGAVIHSLTTYHANPMQQILQHCHFIQQNTALPILFQCDVGKMREADILLLAEIPQVEGIIDIGHHIVMLDRVLQEVGSDFFLGCGNDMNILSHLINGSKVYFSSLANIFPQEISGLLQAAQSGHFDRAKALYQALMPLYQTLTEATLPAGIKHLLCNMQFCQEEVQPPLMALNERQSKTVQKAYKVARQACNQLDFAAVHT